jgi:hypothetical protein
MRRLVPLLLLTLGACDPSSRAAPTRPSATVHVFVPRDAESQGARVPVLYLDQDRALFFPEGVGGRKRPVALSPSELVTLRQRRDVLIVAVDPTPAPPDGPTRYVTHAPP